MVVVADASVAIRGDLSAFTQDLRGAEAATGGLGAKLKNALSPKNIITGAGVLGIGLGIRQLVGYATDAADAFSKLQQTQATVRTVFGDSASAIEDWARRSAEAAGMSQQAVYQSAALFGQTLRNMGFEAEAAADWTVKLQQRAAEMAVAFGQTPERALLAISAAIRGERDTIEKFGVSIKQVDVNAKIAAMGLDVSTDAARRNATAIATLELVMEQTNAQAGRFAEGQDSLAVKMAQANAKINDFMTTQVGPAVASIELGAIRVAEGMGTAADAVGDFFQVAFDPRNGQLAEALGVSTAKAQEMVSDAMRETGRSYDETVDGMLTSAYELDAETWNTWQSVAEAAAEGTAKYKASVNDAADVVANAIPWAIRRNWQEIHDSAVRALEAYQQGLYDQQDTLFTAIDNFIKNLDEDHLAPMEERAELRGRKIILMAERGQALAMNDLGTVWKIDEYIAEIDRRLATLNGWLWGYNLIDSIDQGMKDRVLEGVTGAYALGTVIRKGVGINSEPEDPHSPLRGITKWGGNIVKTIADGIYGELGTGSSAANALAGALVPAFGGGGSMTTMGGLGTGQTINYNLTVNGVPYTLNEEGSEMIDRLLSMTPLSRGNLG